MAAGSRTKSWPLKFNQVGLNNDTNLLKLIAMITMLVDHTGIMLFHSQTMRCVGRLAFPIYAYCIAAGCVYTKNHLKYLSRLVAVGLVSQPFYVLSMAHTNPYMYAISFRDSPIRAALNFYVESWRHPSIFLSLVLGMMLIWALREKQPFLTIALALLIWTMRQHLDYGWRGVVLMVLFYLFSAKWWMALPVVGTFMLWWAMQGGSYRIFGMRFNIQIFALPALIPICIRTKIGLKINKWVFYLFYPAHLIGILLIEIAMKSV